MNSLPCFLPFKKKGLFCLLKEHEYWIPKAQAKYVCCQLNIPYGEQLYYHNLFIWLPDKQGGQPACPRVSRATVTLRLQFMTSFESVAIHSQELHKAVCSIQLCADVKLTQEHQFLCWLQGVPIPFCRSVQGQSIVYSLFSCNSSRDLLVVD